MKKIVRGLAVVSLLAMTSAVLGQDDPSTKAATCSAITDSLARLTCFDRIFPAGAVASLDQSNSTTGETDSGSVVATSPSAWEVESTKSAIDDSPSVTALLMPMTSSGTGIGDGGLAIILRCVENTTSVVLSTTMFMTSENVEVTIRLDDLPAQTTSWVRSTNYKALGLWNGSKAIPFVRDLASASKLVVRVQERDRLDAEFALTDVRSVAAQVAAACNWNLHS
ncbi:type VI secretion system-associated protein TagO [Devosia sp. 2618]|uniref:type VI secretion system-associated protein TagO n=1 Tax=Devosia sp. 2618 TaxID=3156454 RepID=UPI0033966940